MNTRIITVLLLTSAFITGCSMAHGDPNHPRKNPHPVQRYEIIATAKAPGPWDTVQGYLEYQVTNQSCTPEDKFLGVHAMPQLVGHEFEMTRISEDTWRGYFYRDYLQDEDYYGLGACHWGPASVSAVFLVHGQGFDPGATFEDFIRNDTQTSYFKVSEFADHSRTGEEAWLTTSDDPAVAQHPEAFFPITVSVKEVKL
jgi:hypothetical protein